MIIVLFTGLKASIVVLSALNTAIVTFALYKRTTSMGRHHEDFKQVNGIASDVHSYLPAFDTMLRVLSIGTVEYNAGRSAGDRVFVIFIYSNQLNST